MVIVGEHACRALGEENDEQIVSMASHSLLQNGNIVVAGSAGSTSPMAQLAATPERHSHIIDNPRSIVKTEDDELTSLSWLQDTNLLRNIQVGVHEEEAEEYEDDLSHSPFSDDCQDEEEGLAGESPRPGDREATPQNYGHIDYNPHVHISSKPPYSFSCLIFMAIEDTPIKALPVKEIYAWIVRHFPYYQNAPTGWKNSVRHNLSLNKCFRKVEKDKGQSVGKGSLWCIDPEFRPNLLQTLKKAPQCPFSQLEDVPLGTNTRLKIFPAIKAENSSIDMDSRDSSPGAVIPHTNVPSPDLFPYLAKRLSVSTVKSSEVDAAATMLTLKNGSSCQSNMSKTSSEEENTRKSKPKIKRKKKNNRFRNNPGYQQENSSPATTNCQPQSAQRKHRSKHSQIDPRLGSSVRACVPGPVITSSPSEDHTYSASPSQPSSSGSDHNSCSGSPVPTPEDQQNWEELKNRAIKEEEERLIAEEEERCLEEGAQALLSLAKNSLWSDPKRTLVLLQTTPTSER